MRDDSVYATRALVETLLAIASDADPDPVGVTLTTDRPAALESTDGDGLPLGSVPAETPVYAGFTFPEAAQSVNRVFGVDLGTPPGASDGRFVSHPDGETGLRGDDETGPRTLVATPPWTIEALRAYDQSGSRRQLDLVAATTPEAPFDPDRSPD